MAGGLRYAVVLFNRTQAETILIGSVILADLVQAERPTVFYENNDGAGSINAVLDVDRCGGEMSTKLEKAVDVTVRMPGEELTAAFATHVPFVVCVGVGEMGLPMLHAFIFEMLSFPDLALVLLPGPLAAGDSALLDLMHAHTGVRPVMAAQGTQLEAGKVFCVPPWRPQCLVGGKFFPVRTSPDQIPRTGDVFLTCIAELCGKYAGAVLLDCDDFMDGEGVSALRAEGGFSLALSLPDQPKSGDSTSLAAQCDQALPAEALAPRVLAYMADVVHFAAGQFFPSGHEAPLSIIYNRLRKVHRVNFSSYKSHVVLWRVARRMSMHHISSLSAYSEKLRHDNAEVLALGGDILGSETRFFRDPLCFEALKNRVLLPLLQQAPTGEPVRIWVVGCATGEEVYSLAILFAECQHKLGAQRSVRIFATDVKPLAITVARRGVYSERIAAHVSPERLEHYFDKVNGHYHVRREIRKTCLFAVHNVFSNPPFRDMDGIVYRNLHMYFQPSMQQRVFTILRGALRPQGFLFIGKSEFLGESADFYAPVTEGQKIYRQLPLPRPLINGCDVAEPELLLFAPGASSESSPVPMPARTPDNLEAGLFPLLLDSMGMGCAIVDAKDQLLQFSGDFKPYFRLPRGKVSRYVHDLLSQELSLLVARALRDVRASRSSVDWVDVPLPSGGRGRLTAIPLDSGEFGRTVAWAQGHRTASAQGEHESHTEVENVADVARIRQRWGDGAVALVFSRCTERGEGTEQAIVYDHTALQKARIDEMESEIALLRRALEAKVTEMQKLNEELQTSNAEIRAANEELQGSNLELQEANKDMCSLNAQYGQKLQELQELTDDMDNCFNATQVGSIFVDSNLRVRKVTSFVSRQFSLPPDVCNMGLNVVEDRFPGSQLVQRCKEVLHTFVPQQCEVRSFFKSYYMLRIAPYRVLDGSINGLVVTLVDIQQLKGAYARIEAFSYAVDQMPTGVLLADSESVARYVNPRFCSMTGYDAEELCGKGLRALMSDHIGENSCNAAWGNAVIGKSWSGEIQGKRKDGGHFWAHMLLMPVSNKTGENTSYLMVMEDISARKRAQLSEEEYRSQLEEMVRLRTSDLEQSRNEAQAASQAKTVFLSTVSHEIRTPMNAIIGFTHIFDRSNLNLEQKSHLEKIHLSAVTLLGVINDVLDISKIEAGKLELEFRPFDLRRSLDTVRDIMDVAATAKNLSLEVTVDEDVPSCLNGDLLRINQILLNLMNNAVKFTKFGGVSMHVGLIQGVAAPDGYSVLHFTVRDSGIGISAEQLPLLFKSFSQADGSISRRFGGTGLGLAICRELVNLMGGEIGVNSTPNQGTTFHVTLCLERAVEALTECQENGVELPPAPESESAAVPAVSAAQEHQDKPLQGCRVLLVEDNELNQEIATALLEEQLLHVDRASNGLEAIYSAAQFEYDCIFMDMQMPVMDGLQCTRRLRTLGSSGKIPWLNTVPIIAMTANAMTEDRQRCLDAGMNEHIGKPIDPVALRQVLFRFVARRHI